LAFWNMEYAVAGAAIGRNMSERNTSLTDGAILMAVSLRCKNIRSSRRNRPCTLIWQKF